MEEPIANPLVAAPSGIWRLLPESVSEILSLGGPVVLLLLLLSTISLTVIVFKSVELSLLSRRRGARRTQSALKLWESDQRAQAIELLRDTPPGLGELVSTTMQGRVTGQSEALLREEVQRAATVHMDKLRSKFVVLETIGNISPLLGLFGTVLGMIEAFRRMEAAGAQVDPSVLSGGIWQALLTTGVGLGVAIPTVLAHRWLEGRADAQAHFIEDAVTRVFTADLYRPVMAEQPEAALQNSLNAA